MRRIFFYMIGIVLFMSLSHNIFAQWAENKNAREDALYARVLQGGETVVLDGVEDAIWANADSVVVGYGQTKYLPGSGYDLWAGTSVPGDSANAVFKCLYKAPYMYLLYKVVDKSVGGWKWDNASGFDGIIMSFKDNTLNHSWVEAWDKRMEHFYTWGYNWAYSDSFPNANILHGASPLYMGNAAVAGGEEGWRNPAQQERWSAVTVVNGISMDSLPDVGWISEHRINVDSLGFNLDRSGDVLPFSFSMFDSDGGLDSNNANNRWNRTWWGCPWNENWYYSALFIDPNVTTATSGSPIPPVDYTIPHLRQAQTITVDGDLGEWQTDNALHFRAKYGDEAAFDLINGTGAWASGYQETSWNSFPTVVDNPEVDYWVTFDDANLYVSAKVTDLIVTVPGPGSRKDGITFFMTPRVYLNGNGIFPSKLLTVNVDSAGAGQAGNDLVALADTSGVEFALQLGPGTNVNDITQPDSGYTVELKIPFAAFAYPVNLGDSVVFIGGLVNDIDVFDDINSNYYAKAWWFTQQAGQHGPAWVALGPAIGPNGVDDKVPVPLSIELLGNYPNPFNPSTKIKYSVNVNADVTLSVFNILGQRVSIMNKSNVQAGNDEFNFNSTGLSSGVYLYQLKVKNLSNSQVIDTKVSKMVLLK
jgi:hypothetical protein